MSHKYAVGQDVNYQPSIKRSAARDIYKIVARLPVEADELLDAEREEHAHHRFRTPSPAHRVCNAQSRRRSSESYNVLF
jgi:hypothetical protein